MQCSVRSEDEHVYCLTCYRKRCQVHFCVLGVLVRMTNPFYELHISGGTVEALYKTKMGLLYQACHELTEYFEEI